MSTLEVCTLNKLNVNAEETVLVILIHFGKLDTIFLFVKMSFWVIFYRFFFLVFSFDIIFFRLFATYFRNSHRFFYFNQFNFTSFGLRCIGKHPLNIHLDIFIECVTFDFALLFCSIFFCLAVFLFAFSFGFRIIRFIEATMLFITHLYRSLPTYNKTQNNTIRKKKKKRVSHLLFHRVSLFKRTH